MKNYLVENCEVIDNHIVKIDDIINHQIDVEVLDKMACEIAKCYVDLGINKIVTVETSGIALGLLIAQKLGIKNVVYGKKNGSLIMPKDVYEYEVFSYTKQIGYKLLINKKFLGCLDRVLIVDDILASGAVMLGLESICKSAGCEVVAKHVIINKSFSNDLSDVNSILEIKKIVDNRIIF